MFAIVIKYRSISCASGVTKTTEYNAKLLAMIFHYLLATLASERRPD